MKKLFSAFISLLLILSACQRGAEQKQSATGSDVEKRVEELLARMTLDEKIGQLNQYTSRWEMTGPAPANADSMFIYNMIKEGKLGSMLNVTGVVATRKVQQLAVDSSRLGIPLILGYDVIHGYRTMFPIPLGEAASWDPEVAKLSAKVAAAESAAAGLHWTFAPMVDVSRDARWGRVMEGAGEDPYLGSQFAYARVKGFQGDDLAAENTIAACIKHFAAYGLAEAGRDYNTVDLSEQRLQNEILPPFKASVDAGAATFMNSFNTLNGIPATGDVHLQRDILKGDWGFDGFVVSDWGSIGEMINHGAAANNREAAKLAMIAGSDMDMEANAYINELKGLVESGEIQESLIDDAVRRILRIKFRLGLFDDPWKYCNPELEKSVILSEENLQAAREVAKKSIVLLKNENNLLPLAKSGKKIAVIGELAVSKDVPLGNWRAQAIPNSAVSLLEGITAVAGEQNVIFAKGPDYVVSARNFSTKLKFNETDLSGLDAAVKAARSAGVVVIALGEDCFQSGEGRSQSDISLKGLQQKLLDEVYKVNKNVVVVLMNGRPLEINKMAETVPAILETWHLGSQAGNAIADVLFGDYNPSGKLPVSFPRSVGQLPMSYAHFSTGRPSGSDDVTLWSRYVDVANTPLYPFGYGLSYTTFEYSGLTISDSVLTKGSEISATVTLKNSGERFGEEVVQLYIRDLVGSIARPVKELKGFQKIGLNAGESKEITFKVSEKDLEFFTEAAGWHTEPGQFKLWVGTSSAEGLEGDFELK
ncbi:MAG: beta-glucosidase BglX [Draconibacterium sp.]